MRQPRHTCGKPGEPYTTRVESQVNSSFLVSRPRHTCGEPGEQLFPSEAATPHVWRARLTALSYWSGPTTRVESRVNSFCSFLARRPHHTYGEPGEQLFPSEAATTHVWRARWTVRPSQGGWVPVPLFPSKKWPCSLVPPKQNLDFLCSLFPKIACVPLIFRPLLPSSTEKNALVPLFPKTPGRASTVLP